MNKFRFILAALLSLALAHANAEVFQGIKHGYSLAKVKELFPKADIKTVPAAWVTKEDGFYKLSGQGFPGTLYIAFNDYRPTFRKFELEAREEESSNTNASEKEPLSATWKKLADQTDDNALAVRWLRWVPESPIPLQRYISKYGKPEKSGFNDSDMQPYVSWTKRGIYANLSDNEKLVVNVEFEFTKQEKTEACRERTAKKDWASRCNFDG
ncbi:hypothetical protein ACL9RI_17020 [Janthinobacterium sp. Mn2066]|uniref:hypothetical protein n=1 Tax=Janthinobacterium sp. Mn2066 TaxID=3395264 RepID=UPI003BE2EEA7